MTNKGQERILHDEKGSVPQEDVKFVNIYAPNIGAPKYIKQVLTDLKGEVDSNTIMIGVFNTLLTSMDRSSRKSIRRQWP